MVLDYLSDVFPLAIRKYIYTYSRPKKANDYKMLIHYTPAFYVLCCCKNVVQSIEAQNRLMHLTQEISPFAYDVISDLFSVFVGKLQTCSQQSLYGFILYKHDDTRVQVKAFILTISSQEASNHWHIKKYYSLVDNGLCCMAFPNPHITKNTIPSDGVKKLSNMNADERKNWNHCLRHLDLTVNQLYCQRKLTPLPYRIMFPIST